GEQACGDVGPGRMMQPELLAEHCASMFEAGFLAGKKLVITGGPTREALDPVRFISNHSSGKMAYALAEEAANAGANVVLISGPVDLTTPESVTRLDVVSALEMHAAVMEQIGDADIFIGVAAVADYRPAEVAEEKIKKHDDAMQIELVKNPDIISDVANLPQRPLVVGFAAETENVVANGRGKLEKKKLDLLFANHATSTFNSDSIAVTAISESSEQEFTRGSKQAVARDMLLLISDAIKNTQQGNAA
ncbi:MAG: bifunctional phosphopantothenoylcysteine decarboxylase/phosphopantothenate--cysteine ligase CoaBC, partial [Pseudomonadales bacterium]|nr:bifunctional phosphopantothenoylcysteine decarboxylase/phosphopantothenate--cysteine ligase CoaBC [Pseudomonadales bacterium]